MRPTVSPFRTLSVRSARDPLRIAALAACFAALLLAQAPANGPATGTAAQTDPPRGGVNAIFAPIPTVTGPTPHLADGTVDLSGVWMGGGSNSSDISKGLKAGSAKVEMLPWAEEVFKNRQANDDPEVACLPFGVPRSAPYPFRIVQSPTHYFILYEGNIHSYRQIFMDGRPHPPKEELDPTWYGDSIGHWEGETLVIDTIGYNDKFWFDFLGHPHTEQLHTVERYTRTDLGNIQIEVTIDDPGAYKQPFTTVGRARLMPGEELMEYICQENNQSFNHLTGPAVTPSEGLTPATRR